MRKLLISVLLILLIITAYLFIFKGVSFGSLKVLSTSQIIEENNKLTEEIARTEGLINSTFPSETEKLNTSVNKMLAAKEEYQNLANISTKEELNKASTVETYTVEFLWTTLGRHATAKGVNLNYTPSGNNINFTVTGDYIPIINFITAIENDSSLGFTIENFKLIPSGDNLQANFITRNVKIKTESTSSTN